MIARPAAPKLFAVGVFALLAGLVIAGRLLPHPPNLAPVTAVALFAGYFFSRRSLALLVPVAGMALGDLVLGGYDPRIRLVVYAAFLLPVLAGVFLRGRLRPVWLISGALGGSVAFFLASNLAVWAFSGMYAQNPAGLAACYAAALPFFKYTAAGDLLWTAGLFGAYAAALRLVPSRRPAPAWSRA